jgi:hypothetical protein
MKLEEIFEMYSIKLIENGQTRPLSDVLEDIYLLLTSDTFKFLKKRIASEEPDNNIFQEFRDKYEG